MRPTLLCVVAVVTTSCVESAPAIAPAPVLTTGPGAAATTGPGAGAAPIQLAAKMLPAGEEDALRQKFRALAESYIALIRSGRPEEAWRYLTTQDRERIPELAHAAWWRAAVPKEELAGIYVGGVTADAAGGDVSVVTPNRLLLLRVVGTDRPGIRPLELLEARAVPDGTIAADWIPLTTGSRHASTFERELVSLTSLPGNLGRPDWTGRFTGILVDEVLGPAEGLGTEIRSDIPVGSEADSAIPDRRRTYLEPRKTGLTVVADRPEEAKEARRYASPLVLLPPVIKAGVKWNGGTAGVDAVPVTLTSQIIGTSDVETEAGLMKECLVVRASGSATLQSSAGSLRGALSITRWYARGEGLVREVQQEALLRRVASGASEERSRITVFSRLPFLRDGVLAYTDNPKPIVIATPRPRGAQQPGWTVPPPTWKVPSSPGLSASDAAARSQRNYEEAMARADSMADGVLANSNSMSGWAEAQYGVRPRPNADGSVSYTPYAREVPIPTPAIYVGNGGQ